MTATNGTTVSLLITFWIEGNDPHGPIGFGVTAWSIEDAFTLIKERGFRIDDACAVIHRGVQPHEVDFSHVKRNAGPAFFRGVWYPYSILVGKRAGRDKHRHRA
jgi:hypothetical protein